MIPAYARPAHRKLRTKLDEIAAWNESCALNQVFPGDKKLGIIASGISAIGMFAWTPYYPVWAVTIIAVDVLIIYGLAAHGGEIGNESPGGIAGL